MPTTVVISDVGLRDGLPSEPWHGQVPLAGPPPGGVDVDGLPAACASLLATAAGVLT